VADLTFDGTDIKEATARTAGGIYLDVVSGFDGVADVRGTDIVIPGRPGRTPLNRVADRRLIELRGYIHGGPDTDTLVNRQIDYRANVVVFQGLFDPTDAAKALVVTTPYLGLPSGSKSISARFLNAIWAEVVGGFFCRVSVQLEAVGNPPDWA
jgi:hypothetical protein